MKLVVQVLLTFLKFLPDKKVTFGKAVIASITATVAKFPNLPVTIIALQALNDALALAAFNELSGSNTSKAALTTAIKNWDKDFKLTAKYVNFIANGDESIIIGAGFEASKSDSSPSILPLMLNFFKIIASTVVGFFGVSVKGVTDSLVYVFIASPDTVTITQSSNILTVTINGISAYIQVSTNHTVNFENMPKDNTNVLAFGVNNVGMGPLTAPLTITPQ